MDVQSASPLSVYLTYGAVPYALVTAVNSDLIVAEHESWEARTSGTYTESTAAGISNFGVKIVTEDGQAALEEATFTV